MSTLLAAATTAATFFGLCFIDFPSLQELGVLVGSGMLVCGALTLFFVPALVASHRPRPPLTMTRFARVTMASPRAVLGAAAVLTVASAWGARFLALDPTLERLRPTTPAAAIEERLMTDFGLPRDVYLVLARGRDLDRLLAENERLVDALGRERMAWRVSAPSHLMPSAERQREAAAVVAQAPRVEVVREELARAADESGFRPEIFAPFTERLPRLLDATASIDYDGYRAHGLTDLVDRYVARDGDDYVLSTYLAAAGLDVPMVAPHIERAIAATGAPMRLTGLPVVNAELASRFAPEFFRGLAIGSAIVVALIALTFRRLSDTCLALVPVGLALVWSAGLLAWWHVDLDLFSMFAVITFLGIGVDYAIHLIERYREHPEAGVVDALAHVAPAVIVAGSTTLIGFGTLAASSYGPLHSLGVVSLVTIAAAMLSSLVVLPALLAFTASSASPRPRRQPPTATPDSTETGTHERTDHADSSAQRR
ncbi:MAG: MMPL family transporter [Vicinamibacterales bacterium]